MGRLRLDRIVLCSLFACIVIFGSPRTSVCQTDGRSNTVTEGAVDVDLEVELYMLVTSNSADSGKLPARLEGVAKELRSSLPFTNYRLGASFLSRVKNGRPLSVRGVLRSLLVTPALDPSVLPTFYEISAGMLNLKMGDSGRSVVQVTGFRFGLRVAVETSVGPAKDGGERTPTISYEPVGITTDMTVREGEAVVVGTLDAGRRGETLVLVLVASRASQR